MKDNNSNSTSAPDVQSVAATAIADAGRLHFTDAERVTLQRLRQIQIDAGRAVMLMLGAHPNEYDVDALLWGPCCRCRHMWNARTLAYPKQCPRCRSPYWDVPRRPGKAAIVPDTSKGRARDVERAITSGLPRPPFAEVTLPKPPAITYQEPAPQPERTLTRTLAQQLADKLENEVAAITQPAATPTESAILDGGKEFLKDMVTPPAEAEPEPEPAPSPESDERANRLEQLAHEEGGAS